MKNKEINLSSASLNDNENFEEKVLKEEEVKEEKKISNSKLSMLGAKFSAWWKTAPLYKKILVVGIPALIIFGGSAFFFYYTVYGPRTRPPKLLSISTNYIPVKAFGDSKFKILSLDSPSLPRTEESPINGKLFTREEMEKLKERRPIAAMINNHIQARPTSNVSQADLVYEALVEGGITRLVAIFWSREPNKIGPIRSVRQYYIEWISPFDPLFIYDGFAISGDSRVDAAGNLIKYDIKRIYTAGAWRVSDRPAPHNEYSSTIRTWEIGKDRGFDSFPEIESWKFKSDSSLANRNDRFKAKVSISNSDQYNSAWEYDKDTNLYLRSIGGIKDMDLETNQQISAKNVVLQEVKIQPAGDKYNRLIITTIGSGNAAILQDGKIIYGTWEKKDRQSRTRFYDSNKNEIEFNRGLTWISAVRQISNNFDIIEQ
jgi:hypothetical protein